MGWGGKSREGWRPQAGPSGWGGASAAGSWRGPRRWEWEEMGADPREGGGGAGKRLTAWPGVGLGLGLGRGSVGETPRHKKGGEEGRTAGQLDGRMGRAKGAAPKGKIWQLGCEPSLQGKTLVAFHCGGLSFHICGFLVLRRLHRQSSRGGSSPQETPVMDWGGGIRGLGEGWWRRLQKKQPGREGLLWKESRGGAKERPPFLGWGLGGPRAPGHSAQRGLSIFPVPTRSGPLPHVYVLPKIFSLQLVSSGPAPPHHQLGGRMLRVRARDPTGPAVWGLPAGEGVRGNGGGLEWATMLPKPLA